MNRRVTTASEALALLRELTAKPGGGVLLAGAPGTGRTMFARRVGWSLPLLAPKSREHVAVAWMRAGALRWAPDDAADALSRPFRAPHHTCSGAALVGGGAPARPGEASLAHGGVLFLDEAPRFTREAIGQVAQVLREGQAFLAARDERGRVDYGVQPVAFPARPWCVIASVDPCPCGYGPQGPRCRCSDEQLAAYDERVAALGDLLRLQPVRWQLTPVEARSLAAAVEQPSDPAPGRWVLVRATGNMALDQPLRDYGSRKACVAAARGAGAGIYHFWLQQGSRYVPATWEEYHV